MTKTFVPFVIARMLLVAMLFVPALQAGAADGGCGTPVNASGPKTSDCLFILYAAVHVRSCATCTCDVNDSGEVTASDALLCLRAAVGQDVVLTCPVCQQGCPGSVQWTTHAGTGEPCEADEQCPAGTCDLQAGRCRTETEVDLGWKGTSHDVDMDEGSVLRLLVDCDAEEGGCGECAVQGVDASAGNCRCANDTRSLCASPYLPDSAHCPACAGGAFAGKACDADGDCQGGPCARHCAYDPEVACTEDSDCPWGRKVCEQVSKCGNGDGSTCSVDADCIGTCTGAANCECYDAPPQPVASVEFPFCVVPRLASDVSGSVGVDSGESELFKDVQLLAFRGLSLRSPCPVCGGTCAADNGRHCAGDDDCAGSDTCSLDTVAGDGVRDGTCVGGSNDGQPCDIGATNSSFPAGSGGAYSLDCMPLARDNLTGSGLRVGVVETTGASSLPATVACEPGSPDACPCLVCSGSPDVPCRNDEDCAAVQSCSGLPEQGCASNEDCTDFDLGTCTSFGSTRCSLSLSTKCSTNADCESVDFGTCGPATCSSQGSGVEPEPNSCVGGTCTDEGNQEGSCAIGPDDKFCDGIVKADGGGIRTCVTNADCSREVVGFDAGACTLVERRPCFLDPVAADGAATDLPLSVATFCVPPGSVVGVNESIGLPGPARLRRQATMQSFCASDPVEVYVPGADTCPP